MKGKRLLIARRVTLCAVLVAVLASLAFDCGLGTPSSFGVGEFFLLCPLGALEAMIASKSFIPVAAISGGIVLLFSLLFGKAWCAWGCPAPAIRGFFKRGSEGEEAAGEGCGECQASSCGAQLPWSLRASLRHIGRDPRSWSLAAVLLATLVAGLPLFCLVCPIGLTFGTVGSLWHLIVDKQMTASVLVFPLALTVELVLYRKWCMNLCPIAGLLGIFGQVARLFRPSVNGATCLRESSGAPCDACRASCPQHIDLHAPDAAQKLGECTRCGTCTAACPTSSITIQPAPSNPVERI